MVGVLEFPVRAPRAAGAAVEAAAPGLQLLTGHMRMCGRPQGEGKFSPTELRISGKMPCQLFNFIVKHHHRPQPLCQLAALLSSSFNRACLLLACAVRSPPALGAKTCKNRCGGFCSGVTAPRGSVAC